MMDWEKITLHLSKDPVLGRLMEILPRPTIRESSDLYEDLIDTIISQQLSGKAATTILNRFKKFFPKYPPLPLTVLELPDEKIRSAGLSYAKIKYVKGLSEAIIKKEVDLLKMPDLADEEVIAELTKLKGIGKWSAEMILMFSLKRPDVFSVGDLGLRKAVALHYKVDQKDLKKIEKISLRWSPYRTIASRYLWKSLE